MFLVFAILAINLGLLSVNTILWSTYRPSWLGKVAAAAAIVNLLSVLATIFFIVVTLTSP